MGKVNLESKKQVKREQEILECGELMLEEARDMDLPFGYEGISIMNKNLYPPFEMGPRQSRSVA